MAELKTKKNKASVSKFINSLDEDKREESKKLLKIFSETTKEKPSIWGSSIIGFGSYLYESERSSQKGDWFLTGFSPRKKAFSLYIMAGFDNYKDILKDLGKFKLSSGCCIYIKRVSDINEEVLKKLIKESTKEMKKRYLK